MASCAAEAPPHRRWSTSQQETTPPSRHPLHNRPIRSFVVRRVKCCTCPTVHLSHLDSWAVRCSLVSGPRRQDTCCQGVWCCWRGRGQSRSGGGFWWGCWSRVDQRCRSPNTETSRTSRTSPRGLRDRRTVRRTETRTDVDGRTDGTPGQVVGGHASVSSGGPAQAAPHSGGSEHSRRLLLTPPPPQLTEQEDHACHEPQPFATHTHTHV